MNPQADPGGRLCVRNLSKRYGAVEAASGVSFEVDPGEIFGLLGPNGAGQTTVLECILGLRRPDSGEVLIGGSDRRAGVGALMQSGGLQDKVTPREALGLFASFYPDAAAPADLIERFGIGEKADEPFDSLSAGQRQRLFLAIAFVNNPSLLILDEPTAGLDANARRSLSSLVAGLRESGRAVILSTHDMEEAERLCDRIAIIDHGRIVASGSPAVLVAASRAPSRVDVRTERPLSEALARAIPGVTGFGVAGNACWVETRDAGGVVTALVRGLGAEGNALLEIRVRRPSLEDVFVEVTGRRWSEEGEGTGP